MTSARDLNNKRKPFKAKSFNRVDNVLNQVLGTLGLDRRLKEHTVMNLWPVIIGEPWASRSRSLFIDAEGQLVVTVSDASLGQELSLMKPSIIKKLRQTGQSLGVNITGLRFDLKHFYRKDLPEEQDRESLILPEPTQAELDELALNTEELEQLSQLNQSLAADAQSNAPASRRVLAVFEQELRIRHWRRIKGFPLCAACQLPARSLRSGERICMPCYLSRE